MIHLCWNCGRRINERFNCRGPVDIDPQEVGKFLLFDHKTFCSQYCIGWWKERYCGAKRRPLPKVAPIYDWNENGIEGYWKQERKVGRVRPKRR
jgi:hypothetical protein